MKESKEETDVLFKTIAKRIGDGAASLKATDVPNGSAVLGNTWAFGNLPKRSDCNMTPYGVTMMKVLLMGSLKVVAFPVAPLIKALNTWSPMTEGTPRTLPEISKVILSGDAEVLKKWHAQWCYAHVATIAAGDVMVIPTGWILAEVGDGALVYGARKTCVMPVTEDTIKNYSALVEVYKAVGKAKNMSSFLESMQRTLAGDTEGQD